MPVLWNVIEDTKKKPSATVGKSNGVINGVTTKSVWSENAAVLGNMNDEQLYAARPAAVNVSVSEAGSSSICCAPGRHNMEKNRPVGALQTPPQTMSQIAPTIPDRVNVSGP